jgi:hypothetical protein
LVLSASDGDDVATVLLAVPSMLGGFVTATHIEHGAAAFLVAFVANPFVALLVLKLARSEGRAEKSNRAAVVMPNAKVSGGCKSSNAP